ncbi:hypothetical protein [Carp edema virus]|nr:hypothetical protein [Carp edema virus]
MTAILPKFPTSLSNNIFDFFFKKTKSKIRVERSEYQINFNSSILTEKIIKVKIIKRRNSVEVKESIDIINTKIAAKSMNIGVPVREMLVDDTDTEFSISRKMSVGKLDESEYQQKVYRFVISEDEIEKIIASYWIS